MVRFPASCDLLCSNPVIRRRKLAAEPQIHGGKKTRIVFEDLDEPDPKTGLMWRERTEKRDDR